MHSVIRGLWILAAVTSSASFAQGQGGRPSSVVGCLTESPSSTLILGVVPSGEVYSLRGNLQTLLTHRRQLVRVYGHAIPGDNQQPAFAVTKIEVVADTCTAPLPASNPVAVTGKTGQHGVATPDTTTATAGIVSPGVQTSAGIAQQPGVHTEMNAKNAPAAEGRLALRNFAQAGQSEQEANRNAAAAERAEIVPGHTLGVSTQPAAGSATPAPTAEAKRVAGTAPVVVEMKGEELKFFPPKVTIRPGQTVEWVNSSKEVHDVVASTSKVGDKADVQLPAGAEPFDSGFLQPGKSFKHTFTKPGVYRYVCTLHEVQHMVGEIVVRK